MKKRFKRGTGPLVSMIITSRGRPKWLCEAVDSLYSLTKDKSLVEYVFKVDTDDQETIDVISKFSKFLTCRTLISPRGKGYLELHDSVNDLSAIARGDWLFLFNDDAIMKTEDWDQLLLEVDPWNNVPRWAGSNDVCLIGTNVIEREISWEFPILRRKVYEILGHFSKSYSNDSYIYWVMTELNVAFVMSAIKISHFINTIDDLTKREGKLTADKDMLTLNDPELQKVYEIDRNILRDYLRK